MLERFSDGARRVVTFAGDEARRFGHGHVGTEHLLLGILADSDSLAARALVAGRRDASGARNKVAEVAGGKGGGEIREPEFTDRARRALERAGRLSLRRRESQVETEHVLVSVLDVEGRAGQVLRSLAVDLASLRETVDAPPPDPAPVAAGVARAAPPHCLACGTDVGSALAHRILPSCDTDDVRDVLLSYSATCGAVWGAAPL